ncbi:Transcription factor spt20, partial [Tieghemiomyces parasiticus]
MSAQAVLPAAIMESVARPPSSPDTARGPGPIALLRRYRAEPPSIILHLHPTHFRFEQQDGVFLFSSPMRFFLDFIRDGVIPADLVDVFGEAQLRFYEGCLIVELRDHRPVDHWGRKPPLSMDDPLATPALVLDEGQSAEVSAVDTSTRSSRAVTPTTATALSGPGKPAAVLHPRVVRKLLRPGPETAWADLCHLARDQSLTEEEALELEASLLLETEEPLCLDPTFQVARVSNAIAYVTQPGGADGHLKRRRGHGAASETEEAARRETLALLMTMDERHGRDFQPSFNRLLFIQEWRKLQLARRAQPLDPTGILPTESTALVPPGSSKKLKSKKARLEADGPALIDSRTAVYQPVRTLRFEQTAAGHKRYTVLHVFQKPETAGAGGDYKLVLRTGSVPDTSIDGTTQDFELPNRAVLDTYLEDFKLNYEMQHKLVSDSQDQPAEPDAPPPPPSSSEPPAPGSGTEATGPAAAIASAATATTGGFNKLAASASLVLPPQGLAQAIKSASATPQNMARGVGTGGVSALATALGAAAANMGAKAGITSPKKSKKGKKTTPASGLTSPVVANRTLGANTTTAAAAAAAAPVTGNSSVAEAKTPVK